MANENEINRQNIELKTTDEILKGAYANLVQVGHTKEEFIMDFFCFFGANGQATHRAIISPAHAKRLTGAIQANIDLYEKNFGPIPLSEPLDPKLGFKTE